MCGNFFLHHYPSTADGLRDGSGSPQRSADYKRTARTKEGISRVADSPQTQKQIQIR